MPPAKEVLVDTEMESYPLIISIGALQGIAITFAALSIIFTVGRLVYSWRALGRFHLENVFSALAAFLLIPYTVGSLIDDEVQDNIQNHGLGRSPDFPSLLRIQNAFKLEVACTVFFWLIIYGSKATYLTIYWRAFRNGWIARNLWFVVAAIITIFFGIIFFSIFWVCGKPSQIGKLGACQSVDAAAAIRLLTMWCTLNIVDLAILVVFPLIVTSPRNTQLDKRQVLVATAILLLVIFFIALDILRTYWNLTISLSETTNLVFVWRILEPNVAVILAAMSGLTGLGQMRSPMPSISDERRGWIEIETVQKDASD